MRITITTTIVATATAAALLLSCGVVRAWSSPPPGFLPRGDSVATTTAAAAAAAKHSDSGENGGMARRLALRQLLVDTTTRTTAVAAAAVTTAASPSVAAEAPPITAPPTLAALPTDSIAVRLSKRDASLLPNRVFNMAPPNRQVYPLWLRGEWAVSSEFAGFVFPSDKLNKDRLIADASIPGFQKCSIAATADIGARPKKGSATTTTDTDSVGPYLWRVDPITGTEDRRFNYQQAIDAYLGYPAVRTVLYDGDTTGTNTDARDDDASSNGDWRKSIERKMATSGTAKNNPNRIGIDFVNYRTVNAERIELFCNARESQEYTRAATAVNDRVFCCAEYIRQVTFGTGSTVGVPRQAVTNYAHFWTFQSDSRRTSTSGSSTYTETWTGNLLTAAYLDPNDPMYFMEPTLPVALYAHRLVARRPPVPTQDT